MMKNTGVADAVRWLFDADPSVAERDDLADVVAHARVVRGWLDSLDVQIARRSRQLESEGRSDSAWGVLVDDGRRSGGDARAAAEREATCTRLPSFEDALAGGSVSSAHIDALTKATKHLDESARAELNEHEAELLAAAETEYVSVFERRCRQLAKEVAAAGRSGNDAADADRMRAAANVKRWTDQTTGMCHTHLELDPERDAKLWSSIDAELSALKQRDGNAGTAIDQLRCDAVVSAAGPGGPTSASGRVPEITVLIDLDTLITGAHRFGVCETSNGTPLPVSTIRRLCCEADVLPAVLDRDGVVADVGRTKRVATREQRRALRSMYRTCGHPQCDVGFDDCRIHHIIEWIRNGGTDLSNLIPLCSRHHHAVHEGGWQLTMRPDRTINLVRPDGTHHFTGRTVDRSPRTPPLSKVS